MSDKIWMKVCVVVIAEEQSSVSISISIMNLWRRLGGWSENIFLTSRGQWSCSSLSKYLCVWGCVCEREKPVSTGEYSLHRLSHGHVTVQPAYSSDI